MTFFACIYFIFFTFASMKKLTAFIILLLLFSCSNNPSSSDVEEGNHATPINIDLEFTTQIETLSNIPYSIFFSPDMAAEDEKYLELRKIESTEAHIENTFTFHKNKLTIESLLEKRKFKVLSCDTCVSNKIKEYPNLVTYRMELQPIDDDSSTKYVLIFTDGKMARVAQLFGYDYLTNEISNLTIYSPE